MEKRKLLSTSASLQDHWMLTEVLCSTPGIPDCIHQIIWEINSPSMNKENKKGSVEEYEMKPLGSPVAAVATRRMPEALGGFPELCPEELEETEKSLAGQLSNMAVLLSGHLLSQDINVSEVSMNKNHLFQSPLLPEKLNRSVLKQVVKNCGDETPMKVKQKDSPIQEQPDGVFALPAVMGRHQDLRYITSQTMAALLHDQFQSLIEKYCIIDCRYPYEYHGGHIKGALNIHRQDDLFEHFLMKPLLPSAPQKHLILVFHCEFSSERGPKMCRYLREEDRAMNEYPALLYPELYILEGGYKDFFLEYKEMCEPQSYCPMHHQDFQAEMLKFHVKSKTRAGEQKKRDQIAHLMKL
ncbi:M-phase inducer phosphatase 3 isoform X7 [Paroedura picta]|uniref:M-phase inducer phosphatase 3 isoform X7 n=1 Tax=Paroedura picta TaxID=143630 RepID=UPI004057BBFC